MRKRRIRDEKKLGQHRRGPEQPREERSSRTTAAEDFDQLSHEGGSEHRSPISSAWGRGGEVCRDNFTQSVFSQSKGKPSAPNEAGSMQSLETLGLEQGEQESTPVKLPRNPTGKGPHCHLRQTALPSPWASLQASEGLSSCQSVVLSSAPRRRGQVTCRYLMCHWTQTFPQKLSSPKQT